MSEVTQPVRVQCRFLVEREWVPADTLLHDIDGLARYYLVKDRLTCCDVQGGFFIEVGGKLWNEGGVDELWMTDTWFGALDDLLSGKDKASAMPWEESNTALTRSGGSLELSDIHHSGSVSLPQVRVDFREFVSEILREAGKFAKILAALEARVAPDTEQGARLLEELHQVSDLPARLAALEGQAAVLFRGGGQSD